MPPVVVGLWRPGGGPDALALDRVGWPSAAARSCAPPSPTRCLAVALPRAYGPLDATFTGRWSQGEERFGGGWRPNPGADAAVNPPYDIEGRRVS
jgi:hypothetical protein